MFLWLGRRGLSSLRWPALALLLVGCGASDAGQKQAAQHDNEHLPAGDATRGKTLTDRNSCVVCHNGDFAGTSFYPNITPDSATGIGSWTDPQIAAALRDGVNNSGETLCGLMEHFPFSDQDTADVIAFLHALSPVVKKTVEACPGHGR